MNGAVNYGTGGQMDGEIILKARDITKTFPGVKALDKVMIDVREGEVHAICGENGAGKSTLLKIITGIYKRDEGEIYIDDKIADIQQISDARKYGIYVVPQEMQMNPELTVAENIFIGRYPVTKAGLIDWKYMYTKAKELQKQLGETALSINIKSKVKTLSMGHWQLIEIMRALIDNNIRVLAFDEPTSSLSEEEIERLFDLIADLKSKGVSIIYVSHKLKEIFRICDVVTVFKDGKYIDTRKVSEVKTEDIIRMMIGRNLNLYGTPKDRSTITNNVILKAENLSHGNKYHSITFELKQGEILGFYGLIGAGRTEVMRGIFAIDHKDSGELWIKNKKVSIKSPKNAIKHGIGFVTEDRRVEGLMLQASLKWNISMPNLEEMLNRAGLLNLKKETEYAKKALSLFKVKAPSENVPAGGLSGGNQQKVILSKWVVANCDILIVDEPTRGIDVGAKAEVYAELKELAAKGKGIIMVSSELPEVLGVSDRIIVMKDGNITAEMQNVGLTEEDIIKYAVANKEDA